MKSTIKQIKNIKQSSKIELSLRSLFDFSDAIESLDYKDIYMSIAKAVSITHLGKRVVLYLKNIDNPSIVELHGVYDSQNRKIVKGSSTQVLSSDKHPIATKTMAGHFLFIENINDLKKLPKYAKQQLEQAGKIKSFCTAPLIVNSETIGYLVIDSLTPLKYTSSDKETLQFISQKVSHIIKDLAVREYINELIALPNPSLNNVLENATTVISYLVPESNKIAVFIRNGPNSAKRVATFDPQGKKLPSKPIVHNFSSHPVTKQMFTKGEIIIIENVARSKIKISQHILNQVKQQNVKSFINIPIKLNRSVIGYFACGCSKENTVFSKNDISTLQQVSGFVSGIVAQKILSGNLESDQITLVHILDSLFGPQVREQLVQSISANKAPLKPIAKGPAICAMLDISGHSNFAKTVKSTQLSSLYNKFYRLIDMSFKQKKKNAPFTWIEYRKGDEALILSFTNNNIEIKDFINRALQVHHKFSEIVKWTQKITKENGVKGLKIGISYGADVELKLLATRHKVVPVASGIAINITRSLEQLSQSQLLIDESITNKLHIEMNNLKNRTSVKSTKGSIILEFMDKRKLKGVGIKKIFIVKKMNSRKKQDKVGR